MERQSNVVAATLTVRVPLGATGSLADGAVAVVDRIDAVDRIEDAALRTVSPGLNDTTVGLSVRVALAVDDETVARRELEAGVGVLDVESIETLEADPPPAAEVG